MSNKQLLDRIVADPGIMVGKPVIRGTRLTVEYVLNLLRQGASVDEIIGEYQTLEREDVEACLLYESKPVDGDGMSAVSRG